MPLIQCPDCGNEISDQAPTCPRCGRPRASAPVYLTAPPKKTSPLVVGCLVLMGAGLIIGVITSAVDSCSTGRSSSQSAAPPAPDTATEDLKRRATAKLKQTTDWTDPVMIARLCEQANPSDLSAEIRAHCADAHVKLAKQRLKSGDIVHARQAYALASNEGAARDVLAPIDKPLKKAEEAEAKKQRDLERTAAKMARELYAKKLREKYLDDNLDIKVKVSGKDNERLTLEFALFNDVWSHKFQKGDLPDEIKRMGFKRVDMTDGYDYHVYWDLK